MTATYSRLGRIEYSPHLLFAVNKPTAPIDVWVSVWVKQNGPLKSGPKSSKNKEKPLISSEISGYLYNENHSLSEWFKKAYGDEEKSLLKLLSGLPTAQ